MTKIYLNVFGTNFSHNNIVMEYFVEGGEFNLIKKNNDMWLSGVAFCLGKKWCYMYKFDSRYYWRYGKYVIDVSDEEVSIKFIDYKLFSKFIIYRSDKAIFEKKYFNIKVLLNPFLDPRNRDVVDIWFGMYELLDCNLKKGLWRKYPFRFNVAKNDNDYLE